ncbi:MAG: TetR/AcrR family transcriptional regulator [Syntrophaceae bacterium]|nr:TetR/AcrR family transcriptional regulator [Syntrophaceae bacterium]
MGKREQAKQRTRKVIIDAAKELFIWNGFLNTSTKEIADKAGIAHGTLFFHFPKKESLILEIFDREGMYITDQLHQVLHDTYGVEELLHRYLLFLEEEEDFFAIIAREFPYYPEKLKQRLLFREIGIRSYFLTALNIGKAEGRYRNLDVTAALTFLFGTINYLLSHREQLAGKQSIIALKKELIINTFLRIINYKED